MQLNRGDFEAIARFRAGKGKIMLGMLLFGIIWLLGCLIALYQLTFNKDALIYVIVGVIVFVLWFAVYMVIIELRTKQLVTKIKEAYEKNNQG